MLEDKKEIIESLEETVKLTRAGRGVSKLEYVKFEDKKAEAAKITWGNGDQSYISIAGDEGAEIIRDVARYILHV